MKTIFALVIALVMMLSVAACGEPDPVSSPTNSAGLTEAEQTALVFITEHTPQLSEIFDLQTLAVEALSNGDYDGAVSYVNLYVDKWNTIKTEWEDFPAAGGNVAMLEGLFEDTANDLHDIHSGILAITNGQSGEDGLAAIEQFGEDYRALLDELSGFIDTEALEV